MAGGRWSENPGGMKKHCLGLHRWNQEGRNSPEVKTGEEQDTLAAKERLRKV